MNFEALPPDVAAHTSEDDHPLLHAAFHGDVKLVRTLLSKGLNPDAASSNGDTALISSTRRGYLDVVDALLKAGAKPDIETTCGNYTALALAARFGHCLIVERLLESHASVNYPSFNAFTPLMFASQYGHTGCIRALLDAQARTNLRELGGRTALLLAAENGHYTAIDMLLEAGADTSLSAYSFRPDNVTALHRAAHLGYDHIVRRLLQAGAGRRPEAFQIATEQGHENVQAELMLCGEDGIDPDKDHSKEESKLDKEDLEIETTFEPETDEYDSLPAAAGRGDAVHVQSLLDTGLEGVDVSLGSESILLDAIRSKDLQTVKILTNAIVGKSAPNIQREQALIDFGNKWGLTPLILAARMGRLDMVKVLLDAGANPNQLDFWKRRTALIEAVRQGRYNMVELLIQYKCDVNVGGKRRNPLGHACDRNDMRMVELLITAGADVSHLNSEKAQPLNIAVQNGSMGLAKMLIAAGADVDGRDLRNNRTAMITATMRNDPHMIDILLTAGANIDTTMLGKWTALAFAARDGHQAATEILVERSAGLDHPVSKCYTPLLLAARNGHTNVVRFLISKGADLSARTSDGESAFQLAKKAKHDEVCALLLQSGIEPNMEDISTQHTIPTERAEDESSKHSDNSITKDQNDQLTLPHSNPPYLQVTRDVTFATMSTHVTMATLGKVRSSSKPATESHVAVGRPESAAVDSTGGNVSVSNDSSGLRSASHEISNVLTTSDDLTLDARLIPEILPEDKISPLLCEKCIVMIPPMYSLEVNNTKGSSKEKSKDSDNGVSEQELSYTAVKLSAQNGCPGCRMALSFLLRHWSHDELLKEPIFRHLQVNEKDKKRGFGDFQKLETLYEGGSKQSKTIRNNARLIRFTPKGIGIGHNSPEELQDKLLQREKDAWDFQVLLMAYRVGDRDGPICRFVVYADSEDPAAVYTSSRLWERDLQSETAYKTAKSWLDECEEAHEDCKNAYSSPALLPTRVIDVGSNGDHLKLCTTQGKTGAYVALSYCWGGPQAYCTTTNNLQNLSKGIDGNRLPQTVKDAIEVTCRLGLRYLWVDAFCIVQDSDVDKSREISNMSNVFKNAHLTISAAHAAQCTDGFLQEPQLTDNPDELPRFCRFPVQGEDGKVGAFLLEGPITDWSFLGNHPDPIMKRAWTMQEHWLSPRLLFFGTKGMSWLCHSSQQRYGGTNLDHFKDNLPQLDKKWYEANEIHAGDSTRAKYINGVERVTSVRLWESLVVDYTKRVMSNANDKLPALSALAQEFGRVTKDEYLAGLWRKALLHNLMWYLKQPTAKIKAYRAPSFSWASVDGPVDFIPPRIGFQLASAFDCVYHRVWLLEKDENYQPFYKRRFRSRNHFRETEINDCEITLKDDILPYGQVTGGSLTISSRIRPVTLLPRQGQSTMIDFFTEETLSSTVLMDTTEFEKGIPKETQIWALPMRGGSGPLPLDGLLITPVAGTGRWRRMGVFAIGRLEKPERYRYTWLGLPTTVTIV